MGLFHNRGCAPKVDCDLPARLRGHALAPPVATSILKHRQRRCPATGTHSRQVACAAMTGASVGALYQLAKQPLTGAAITQRHGVQELRHLMQRRRQAALRRSPCSGVARGAGCAATLDESAPHRVGSRRQRCSRSTCGHWAHADRRRARCRVTCRRSSGGAVDNGGRRATALRHGQCEVEHLRASRPLEMVEAACVARCAMRWGPRSATPQALCVWAVPPPLQTCIPERHAYTISCVELMKRPPAALTSSIRVARVLGAALGHGMYPERHGMPNAASARRREAHPDLAAPPAMRRGRLRQVCSHACFPPTQPSPRSVQAAAAVVRHRAARGAPQCARKHA